MGWLFMKSLSGHCGPRQYLDAQFTYESPEVASRVLRSALVRLRVYYAAVEHVHPATAGREVWAAVCLVKYNPRDAEGYIFGYKDMTESMGPCEAECPESILNLLTPTDNQYAQRWRARCHDNAAARRALSRKPLPRPGQFIIFDRPLLFSDGCRLDRFEVVAHPQSRRALLFRDPASGLRYRISNIKTRAFRVIDASAPDGFGVNGSVAGRASGTSVDET